MSGEDSRSNPYVGLRPFFEEDSLYFYGRETQTAELLDILCRHRFLGVLGSSGSGKSSLVRAGLLPGLQGGFLVQDRDAWRIARMRPGDAPIVNLCAALLDALGTTATPETAAALVNDVRDRHTAAVLDLLRPRLDARANLLLLADQFEEVFAFRGGDVDELGPEADTALRRERARRHAEAAEFVDLLLALAEQRELPVYVVLTMRTDFLGDCDLFHGLPEALNRARYLVPRMKREQLRDAVECPALLMEARVAPRLLDHVLNELGDRFDRLPVLQHALMRTWDRWDRAGRVGPVDLLHFKEAGGLDGALDQDAEDALKGLDVAVVARVFQRLTDTDTSQRRVRRPARVSELMAAAGTDRATVQAVVQRFEGEGRSFLHRAADGAPDDPRVDISHESLIRQWGRLRGWVDDERRSRDEYLELVHRLRKRMGSQPALLQDPELQLALDWRERSAPTSEWALRYTGVPDDFDTAMRYLEASLAGRQEREATLEWRRRWSRVLMALILLQVMGALVLLGKRLWQDEPNLLQALETLVGNGHLARSRVEVVEWLSNAWELVKNYHLPLFLLYMGACARLNLLLERLHQARAMPRIRRQVAALSAQRLAQKDMLPVAARAVGTLYATTLQRLRAGLLDIGVQVIRGGIAFLLIMLVLYGIDLLRGTDASEASDAEVIVVLVGLALVNWWTAIRPLVSDGQATRGMRRAGIYRADLYGQRLTLARATVWYLVRIPSFVFYGLGFLAQPFMPRRQTLHDWLAGTVVLVRKP